jgi:hypothetical protein
VPKFKMLSPGRWGEKNLRDYNYAMRTEQERKSPARAWAQPRGRLRALGLGGKVERAYS